MCTDLPFAFPIRVPDNLLVEFGKFTGLRWNDTFAMEPFVCEALRNFMNPAPAAQEQTAAPTESGYQWKEVFLPEGTRLRASFDHQQYFAVVAGAEIKYGEHAISPSCFANLFGSGNRNAWKAVWLRPPGSTEWLLADVCRAARKAAIARLMGSDPLQAGQSSPAAPRTFQDDGKQQGKQLAKQPTKQPAKPSAKQPAKPAPRGTGESGIADGALVRAARHAAARQSGARSTEVGPSSARSAATGSVVQRKKSSGRSARRKRRAAKHIPETP
jgi:hypothetical protein